MANLSERPASERPTSEPKGMGNGVKGFFLGILFTLILQLVAGGAYFFARQTTNPPATGSIANRDNRSATSPATSANSTSSSMTSASPEATAAAANSAAANAAANSGATRAAAIDLPSSQTVDVRVSHPNGVKLQVTGVSFADANILVKMAATNGHAAPIMLNGSDMILQDNLGNQYNFAAPPTNKTIRVAPNTTLKGEFSFVGRIAPGATSLTLTTNSQFGGDQDFSDNPKMIVEIPVQWSL